MTLCKHELRSNRVSLLIWAGVVCAMTALTMLLFPSFKDQMGTISSVFAMMGPFTAALGLDVLDFSTAGGFYAVEAGTMLAVGGAMFAAFLGIGLLAKEEGGHTAEFLLTQPIPRVRVVAEKLLSMVIILCLFNIICALIGWLCFALIAEPLPAQAFVTFHALQLLMHIEIGCICFAFSAFAQRTQVGLGLGIAMLLYFLSLVANMVDSVAFLRYVTPFAYADASAIFSAKPGVDAGLILIGAAVSVVACATAFTRYTRKDIAA